MGVLGATWCFCSGGGKSERLKATVFATKSAAMATLSSSASGEDGGAGEVIGCGFLIHRNLLLTTHVNLPSASAAESSEIRLQNGVVATLNPHRFFITSSVLDLTIVGLDSTEGDSNSPGPIAHHLKTSSSPNLDLGEIVYVLGYTNNKELTISEGKVVIATDNLIKFSTEGVTWSPGSAGFDANGNLAFMICDPMKLATSPYTKSSPSPTSSTSSSCKRDRETLFGIPMPIISGWLNQHWEGGVDEHSKPKLPLMRLVSADQSWSEHHEGSSIITNEIFKASEADDLTEIDFEPRVDEDSIPQEPSVDQLPGTDVLTLEEQAEVSSSGSVKGVQNEAGLSPSRVDVLTVEGSGSSADEQADVSLSGSANEVQNEVKLSSSSVDILTLEGSGSSAEEQAEVSSSGSVNEVQNEVKLSSSSVDILILDGSGSSAEEQAEVSSSGSAYEVQNEVKLSSSRVDILILEGSGSSSGSAYEVQNGSEVREGKLKMGSTKSVETAESSNYTATPREARFRQSEGRGKGGVKYNHYPVARKSLAEKRSSMSQPRKPFSQGARSEKSRGLSSPTVSSIMKKRNANLEEPKPAIKTRQTAVSSSPRWAI